VDLSLEGVYVPVVTPFDADGDLDLGTLRRVVEHLLDAGVHGIVACGTTGEYYALDEAERLTVMRAIHGATAGRAALVAGCNAGATRQSITLATAARDLGYDAVMLAAPATSLPQQHELAAHFVAVAEAAGLPTILYNYPARAGVEIGLDCLDRVAGHPLIVGLKESSGDFSRLLTVLRRYAGQLTIMCGSDDQAADYFFWGVRGWLAGTANVLPRQHVDVLAALRSGDHEGARDLFVRLLPWIQQMESGSYNQKAKLGLRHLGFDCGEVRPPLLPLGEEDAAAFLDVLDAARR
jgi:4-hydroxy-tetrahydrodipicolinate synthase